MKSFDAFQQPIGIGAYEDPLAAAGQIEVEGLAPGDLAMSEDLAAGLQDALRDHLDAEASDAPTTEVAEPTPVTEPESAAPTEALTPTRPVGGSSGGGGW